ncbi:MAG: hypothetical protein L3K03_00985 [Thermoplasmata archaeon]|nr:hypothetical protein [Thermoplasmata archaeon]
MNPVPVPDRGVLNWPLAGLSALLVLLIVLTPDLVAPNTPTAGCFGSAPKLDVDQPLGMNVLKLYVDGVETIRFLNLSIAIANATWPPPPSAAGLNWSRWANASESLFDNLTTSIDPVAVNVTATYVDPQNGRAVYGGQYVLAVSGTTLLVATLTPALSGTAPSAVPLDTLPVELPLTLEVGACP